MLMLFSWRRSSSTTTLRPSNKIWWVVTSLPAAPRPTFPFGSILDSVEPLISTLVCSSSSRDPPVPYPFPNAPTFQPADNVVHPPHSSGELKARPGLHLESPVFGPSAAETSDSKRAPEQPRRSVTPAKDDKQQFHGNGSELLQLLQGGPGRVKPTASTKVDATQDSGDSGEPSKKGSPSAVHGPIGPPRRHVVSPPQSPNDLLGRLWAALPSSSHTLFDGESERKPPARSFGVEVNEMSREVDGGGAAGFALLKRRGSEPAASHYL
ncbi:uncharacterized protein LOC9645416 [Selaginella moellendorffii]|uniref:uncharacterized protein LOC9645416 n=1 Tax=Selaginella moellendorffii TaxID=88036 RepID=UPI000D1C981B|nr:uncharacterized protein LOC9645416 [Selaginella moellendorffii]|eukprot:XP_024522201.1 uncharacterized protein LOC9645416 [Selaginella moellendorffii]